MKTLLLDTFTGVWSEITAEIERSTSPVLLRANGQVCGILLPSDEARRVATRYADIDLARRSMLEAQAIHHKVHLGPSATYLDLLIDDPSLVPVENGRPLEFRTMMNTSFVDPQQLYEFRDPQTTMVYTYLAKELQQLIGWDFSPVAFIPNQPADYVRQQRAARQKPASSDDRCGPSASRASTC